MIYNSGTINNNKIILFLNTRKIHTRIVNLYCGLYLGRRSAGAQACECKRYGCGFDFH